MVPEKNETQLRVTLCPRSNALDMISKVFTYLAEIVQCDQKCN